MKKLYYNPIEMPLKVHIVAKCFGVDMTDEEPFHTGIPCYMEPLFELAKIDCFDEVEVYVTSHNGAYIRDTKKPMERTEVTGWVSLKNVRNGGGYLEDKGF